MKKGIAITLFLSIFTGISVYGLTDSDILVISGRLEEWDKSIDFLSKFGSNLVSELIKIKYPTAVGVLGECKQNVKKLVTEQTTKIKESYINRLQKALNANPALVLTKESLEELEKNSPYFAGLDVEAAEADQGAFKDAIEDCANKAQTYQDGEDDSEDDLED